MIPSRAYAPANDESRRLPARATPDRGDGEGFRARAPYPGRAPRARAARVRGLRGDDRDDAARHLGRAAAARGVGPAADRPREPDVGARADAHALSPPRRGACAPAALRGDERVAAAAGADPRSDRDAAHLRRAWPRRARDAADPRRVARGHRLAVAPAAAERPAPCTRVRRDPARARGSALATGVGGGRGGEHAHARTPLPAGDRDELRDVAPAGAPARIAATPRRRRAGHQGGARLRLRKCERVRGDVQARARRLADGVLRELTPLPRAKGRGRAT